MTYVMACIDESPAAVTVCDCAVWANQKLEAPLLFMHVLDRREYPGPGDLSGNIGLGSREQSQVLPVSTRPVSSTVSLSTALAAIRLPL